MKKKSRFCVYGLKDLADPSVICISGLAGIIFEGYYVWFSEEDVTLVFGMPYLKVGCGIRLTETSYTVAWGRGFTREGAFESALKDLELYRKGSKISNSLWKDQWHVPWGSVS